MAKDQVWLRFTQTQPKHFTYGYPNLTQTQFVFIKKIFNNVIFKVLYLDWALEGLKLTWVECCECKK